MVGIARGTEFSVQEQMREESAMQQRAGIVLLELLSKNGW